MKKTFFTKVFDDVSRNVPVPLQADQHPIMMQDPEQNNPFMMLRNQPDEVIAVLRRYARQYNSFWWGYTIDIANPNGSVRQTKNMQFDSYFAAQYMIVNPLTVATVVQNFELTLMDTSANYSYSDVPLPYALIAGTAQNPFWFPWQILFSPNSQLTVAIRDLSGNANNHIELLIGGVRYHL